MQLGEAAASPHSKPLVGTSGAPLVGNPRRWVMEYDQDKVHEMVLADRRGRKT